MTLKRRIALLLVALAQLTAAALLALTTLAYHVKGVEFQAVEITTAAVERIAAHDSVTMPEDDETRARIVFDAADPAREYLHTYSSGSYSVAAFFAALALPMLVIALFPGGPKARPAVASHTTETVPSSDTDG